MQGYGASEGDILVTMDADLQDVPGNIRVLVDELEEGGFGLVSGLRFPRKDTSVKIFISWIFNWLVRMILRKNFHDVNSGMKAYTRELYKKLELKSDLHRLIPVMAADMGFKVCEKPVSPPAAAARQVEIQAAALQGDTGHKLYAVDASGKGRAVFQGGDMRHGDIRSFHGPCRSLVFPAGFDVRAAAAGGCGCGRGCSCCRVFNFGSFQPVDKTR